MNVRYRDDGLATAVTVTEYVGHYSILRVHDFLLRAKDNCRASEVWYEIYLSMSSHMQQKP